MRSIVIVLFTLIFSGPLVFAQQTEPLKSESARKNICAQIVGQFKADAAACWSGAFEVTGKVAAPLGDRQFVTKMIVKSSFKDTQCFAELLYQFPHKAVSSSGRKIIDVQAGWNVRIRSCNNKLAKALENAHPGVNYVSLVDFSVIPAKIQAVIREIDFGFELGDGYYDMVGDPRYFQVTDPANKSTVVGYLVAAKMSYTESPDDEPAIFFARVSADGHRVGEIEAY